MSSNSLTKLSSLIRQVIQRSPRKRQHVLGLPALSPPRHLQAQHQLQHGKVRWNSSAAAAAESPLEDLDDESTRTQQEEPLDAFRVLNLERKFDLSEDELKQAYRHLMTTLHPDKNHSKPLVEQEYLREQASQVTQSYQLLKDIPTRATHMLQLLGRVSSGIQCHGEGIEESTLHDLLGAQPSPLLLMEIMEIREAIEDATSDAELQPLLEENNARLEDVYQQLSQAFQPQEGDDAPNLDRALECTVMVQYYSRIDEAIREKMEN